MAYSRGSQVQVLIVEDEVRLARNVAEALTETTSFAVDMSTDGGTRLASTHDASRAAQRWN